MRIVVLQEDLQKALATVSRFVSARVQLPVLSNILLSADQAKLRLIATNLEMGISYDLGAKVEQAGALTVPAKLITELVSSLPPGQIYLEEKQERLSIQTNSFMAELGGILASEFPSIPTNIQNTDFSLSREILQQIAKQVVFAAATDDTRPILTGVLLIFSDGKLRAVATDGFRLSCRDIASPLLKESKRILLPARVLDEITRIVPESDLRGNPVAVSILEPEKQVLFGTNSLVLTGRVLEGEFPDFEKIIPKSFNLRVLLDKDEFTRAVRVAAVLAREASNVIKFSFERDKLVVAAESQQYGQERVVVEAKVEGEPISVAFNYKFVLDFLGSVEGKQITFESEGSTSPGVFRDSNDTNYTHLIMPVRLQQ